MSMSIEVDLWTAAAFAGDEQGEGGVGVCNCERSSEGATMNSQGLVTTSGNGTTRYTGGVMNIHESSAVPAVDERRRRDGPSVGLPVRISKWFLLLAAWGVFVWWISLWFRMPSEEGKAFKKEVSLAVNASTFWGKYGKNLIYFVLWVSQFSEWTTGGLRRGLGKIRTD